MEQRKNEHYTYADYLEWDDGQRWELIEGVPYAMSPAPNRAHQEISGELFLQLANFLKGKSCKVFHAPFDVRLNANCCDDTVVQPDVLVVCDKSKLDDKSCKGAPDMAIEIISPSSSRHDRVTKLNKYQQAGVREYWIVYPDDKTVEVYILTDGKYASVRFTDEDTVDVHVLEGCKISLTDVFAG